MTISMACKSYLMVVLVMVPSTLFCLTDGSGKLHIHFLQYTSGGKTVDGIRCDPGSNDSAEINDLCDPQFIVNVEREMKGGENIFSYQQLNFFNNRETIPFLSKFAEMPNPVVVDLNYDDNQGNVWLEVIVMDHDADSGGQLMTKFGANLQISTEEVRYMELKRKLNDNLSFRYWFSCNANYFGPQCNKLCVGHNDNVNGHSWCNSIGKRFCLFGWIDIHSKCKTLHPCRTCVCKNGGLCMPQDTEGYRCQCPAGFYGVNCENCDVGGSSCGNGNSDPATRNCDSMQKSEQSPTSSAMPFCKICPVFVLLSNFIVLYLSYFYSV